MGWVGQAKGETFSANCYLSFKCLRSASFAALFDFESKTVFKISSAVSSWVTYIGAKIDGCFSAHKNKAIVISIKCLLVLHTKINYNDEENAKISL